MKTRHEQFINLDSVKCMYTYASTGNRRKIVLLLSLKALIGENWITKNGQIGMK